MSVIDTTIVLVYLVALFAWAIYIGLRETAEDFLVFSRKAPFLLVVFSIISTWVGVGTTVATAASGFRTGISLGFTAGMGGVAGALSAAWIAPRLKRFGDTYGAHTIGDFIGIRFSRSSRLASSILILFVYIVLTAAQFVGMAALLRVWTDQSFAWIILFAAVSTIFYTAFAGLKGDFYTDVVHFVFMTIALFLVLLPITFIEAGGFSGLRLLPSSHFDPFAYGGLAFFIGGLIFGAGSVFVMMELWQRVYASSSPRNARRALVSSILIIVLFYSVATLLGLLARVLMPELQDADQALFRLMLNYLPQGVLGLGVAAFLAIFLSTLDSTIMVASATATKDIYCQYTRKRSINMLRISRIATVLCGTGALLLSYAVPDIVVLSVNGMFLLLVLLPSILGGLFFKRITSKASFVSIVGGLLTTAVFFFIDPDTAFVPGFVVSLICLIVVSLMTTNSSTEDLRVVAGWQGSTTLKNNSPK